MEVTQEEYDKLQKIQKREAGRKILRKAQQTVLKDHRDEVEAEVSKMSG